jgi:hypothetical protein
MKDIHKYLFMYCLNIVLIISVIKAISSFRIQNLMVVVDVILIGCVLYLYFNNKYLSLPFLGESVIPMTAIADEKYPPNADSEYELKLKNVEDGVKVIYWGAQKDDKTVHSDPYDAYGKYENVGIAIFKDNKAILKYLKPVEYKVGITDQKLPRHLHYRLCCKNKVMLSEVHTINLD